MTVIFLIIGLFILCYPIKSELKDKNEDLRAQLHAERAGKLLAENSDQVTSEILLTLCEIEIENHMLLQQIQKNTCLTSRIASFSFKLAGIACILLGIASFFSFIYS